MSYYPDVITDVPASLPIECPYFSPTLITKFESGVEQRRLLSNAIQRNVKIFYKNVEFAQANTLRRFYEDRRGSFHSFDFFFPQYETFVTEYVGVIVDPTDAFYLPSLEAQSFTLFRNEDPLTEGVGEDWVFTIGVPSTGTPDLATLPSDAAAGELFRFSFTGRLKMIARFDDQQIVVADIKKYWSSLTISLKGLEHIIP